MTRWTVLVGLLFGTSAWAGDSDTAMTEEVDRARAQVTGQVQFLAYDLIDDLVYDLSRNPIFDAVTPVVLADISVPVGLGTGLSTLVENHLTAAVIANPDSRVQLSHCPACTATVVYSGPSGTTVSRGYDNPAVLERLADAGNRHALFVDLEAQGASLVLRARLTRLTPDLPIVWAHSHSTSLSQPASLRDPTRLMSQAEARQAYLDILNERSPLRVPVRFTARTFRKAPEDSGIAPPPFLWVQTGVELSTTQARAWTGSLTVGGTHVPLAYSGLMAEARVNRLLTGRTRSLTRPDLYLFFGGSVMTIWGLAAASFQNEAPDLDGALAVLLERDPRTTLGTLHLGLDLRIGRHIGVSGFVESLPGRRESVNLGDYVWVPGISVHSVGTEVTLWL